MFIVFIKPVYQTSNMFLFRSIIRNGTKISILVGNIDFTAILHYLFLYWLISHTV